MLPACGAATGAGQAVVRDSAGIQIVDNGDREPEGNWRLLQPPLLTLGAQDSSDPAGLFRVVAAVRFADGRIVVANAGTTQLKFYGRDGRFLHSAGRAGSGPGEFREIDKLLVLAPDSLLVFDGALERLSVFDARRSYARLFHFDAAIDPIVVPSGVFADGVLLALKGTHMVALTRQGVNVDSALILRFDRNGAFVDSLGRFAENWRYRKVAGDLRTVLPVPLAPRGQLVLGGDGYCAATGETFSLQCFDAHGSLRRIIRLDYRAATVTDAMVRRYYENLRPRLSPNARRAYQRLQQEIPRPAQLPALANVRVDSQGDYWMLECPDPLAPPAAESWRVFSPDGQFLDRVSMPPRFSPLQIGTDFVLGSWFDDLDVEYIRLYCLSRDHRACSG